MNSPDKVPNWFAGTVIALAGMIFSLDLFLPLGIAGGVPYVAVVLVSLWSPKRKHTLLAAGGCTLLTILGFFLSPIGGVLWIVLVNRALAIFAIWVVALLGLKRQESEARSHRTDERLRLLMDSTAEAIYGLDLEGNCTFANPSCLKMLGYEKLENLLGKNMHDLIHHTLPDGNPYPEKDCHIHEAFTKGKNTHVDDEVLWRADGTSFPAEYWSYPIRRDGGIIGAVVTFLDITERKQAESELKENRNRLEMALWSTNLGVWDHDLQSDTFVIDERVAEMFGYKINEMELTVFAVEKSIHPDDLPKQRENLEQTLSGETEFYESEQRMRTKSGDWIWILDRGRVTERDKEGTPLRMTGTQQDITARKQAEEALRQNQTLLEQAQEIASLGSWELDIETDTRQVSKEVYRLFGLDPIENPPQDYFYKTIHPEDRPRVQQAFQETLETGEPYDTEYRRQMPGGTFRHFHSHGVVTEWRNGKPAKFVGTVQDITDRKQAEEALQQSEARFRSVFQFAPLAIDLSDLQGNILDVNPEFSEMLGYTREEFLKMTFSDFSHPEDRQKDIELFTELLEGKRDYYQLEKRHIRKNGKIIWVYVRVSLIKDPDGNILFAIGMIHDITERKIAEEALAAKAEELARSNADLEQFAYVASHDLQEPLRMVTSFTQLLQRRYGDKLDGKANEYIGFAVDGTKRMQSLIKALLDYSRAGQMDKSLETVSCDDILAQTLTNLGTALGETKAVVTHDPLPAVFADEVLISQLFQNLIGNALKFHGEEPPRIHVSAERTVNNWVFSVRDNGLGIDPEFQERIFIIFQRLHQREDYPGTGIGLSLCKKIVESHGGRIWVESQPGYGSTFYFSLPLKGVHNHEPAQRQTVS